MKRLLPSLACLIIGIAVLMFALSSCSKKTYNTTVSYPAPEVTASPVASSTPAPSSTPSPIPSYAVTCDVYDIGAPISSIPDLDVLTPAYQIGMSVMSFAEVDESTPFAQFVGTPAEHVVKNFALRCETKFEAESTGKYQFKLISDDGSKLYFNGVLAISNDGQHAMATKTKNIDLSSGSHTIRVDYFQNFGSKGLTITVKKPASPAQTL